MKTVRIVVAGLGWIRILRLRGVLGRLGLLRLGLGRLVLDGAFDDLVEFATIEPDSTALGTVVDFDALTVGHNQIHFFAYGTFHCLISSEFEGFQSLPRPNLTGATNDWDPHLRDQAKSIQDKANKVGAA
jgi:hypothetical protein